ncbi:A disintegrin and metalloproteinase with thrombospondin motifs 15-like [Gastrophryne carolinensis]
MNAHLTLASMLALDLLAPSLDARPAELLVTPKKLHHDLSGPASSGVVFQISAFREDFYLNLRPDSQFMAPAFSVHFPGGVAPKPSPNLRHCFYSGDVNRDRDSFAALSLCGGLRGAFGYRGDEYFISPVGNGTSDGALVGRPGPHLLRRRDGRGRSADATSRCGVGSGASDGVARALQRYKGAKHGRHHGNHNHGNRIRRGGGRRSRRFASVTRHVETLIVADETMLKFHGDDLQLYLLTLMATAARLYRHHSIRNPINIAVVKFMVLTDDGKGPKVSGNAAMTLRSFCGWQRKWNKASDKHPEYWDTAILFTKTVSDRAV